MIDLIKNDWIHYCKEKKWRRLCPSSIEHIYYSISISKVVNTLGFHIQKPHNSIMCPYHKEKNPSCNIVEWKARFFCKWCWEKWYNVDIVMHVLNKNLIQATKWLQTKFLPNYKLKFENMYWYEEINAWDMSDYENDCLLNGSDPMILTWWEIDKAQEIEDYEYYVQGENERILTK
jgi:hypothetical protein